MDENPPPAPAREPYRAIFESAPSALVTLSPDGRLLLANRAARDLGVDIERLAAARTRRDTEVRAVDASGRPRVFVLDEAPVEGLGDARLVCIRDVTERCAIEEELFHLRRVESFGHIAASVVHDFNNILTPIVCTSALLTNALAPDSAEGQMVAEMRMAAERAAGLVRQVLRIARKQPSLVERVDVNAAISEMRWLANRAVREEVRVSFELSEAPLDVMVDREQLEHALLNLIVNSHDATPDGGRITVTTSCISFADDAAGAGSLGDGYVSIAVVDTGAGMEPQVLDRVFDSFFTTKPEGEGTGLGLASVRRFVARSGGCVSVRSTVGQGTTVVLYLPRAKPGAEGQRAGDPSDGEALASGEGTGGVETRFSRADQAHAAALDPWT